MKTFELALKDFADATAAQGHIGMRVMDGSQGRTWECDRCGARVYRENGVLRGWALEHTCNEVNFLMRPGTEEEE